MELEKWFKTKRYPHIGTPITLKDYKWVKKYVENPEKIRVHSFLPFIHKIIIKRKFRTDTSQPSRTPTGKRIRIKGKPKVRDIFFASHLDSLIFSKYNELLSDAYNRYIRGKPFDKSVVAYRKIPISEGAKHNKCNIDFAKTVFEYIHEHKHQQLSVIIADITSFFDNLKHSILKRQWAKVLKCETLPKDYYNIFKALTNIKYVKGEQLFEAYKKTMIVERGVPNSSKNKELVRKPIQSSRFFKEKNAVAYCKKDEFLKNNLNLVISKSSVCGIPQGSPISATLANIYMLEFDDEVFKEISLLDGFYQRYSDDLVIVCEQKYEDEILKLVRDRIENLVCLKIEPNKTKVFRFQDVEGIFRGFEIDADSKRPIYNKKLEYLGFSFDGNRILIRPSGFSKLYRALKGAFNRATSFALHSKNPDKKLFKSRLYKRFTHKGAKRKLIYRPSREDRSHYVRTEEYYWGNYLSYVYKANETMKSLNKSDLIKRQSRKLWNRFNKILKNQESIVKEVSIEQK